MCTQTKYFHGFSLCCCKAGFRSHHCRFWNLPSKIVKPSTRLARPLTPLPSIFVYCRCPACIALCPSYLVSWSIMLCFLPPQLQWMASKLSCRFQLYWARAPIRPLASPATNSLPSSKVMKLLYHSPNWTGLVGCLNVLQSDWKSWAKWLNLFCW